MTPTSRRNFLGWLSGSLALYAVGRQPVDIVAENTRSQYHEPVDPDEPKVTGAQTYVIKNFGDTPMSIHYNLVGVAPTEAELTIRRDRRLHVSTLILPGEELTISAAPMQD